MLTSVHYCKVSKLFTYFSVANKLSYWLLPQQLLWHVNLKSHFYFIGHVINGRLIQQSVNIIQYTYTLSRLIIPLTLAKTEQAIQRLNVRLFIIWHGLFAYIRTISF